MRTRSTPGILLCAAALGLADVPAAAQSPPSTPPASRVVARHWSDVPADTAALGELLEASWAVGGESVLRAVLAAAADPARPLDVRLYALAGLAEFMERESGPQSVPALRAAAERALRGCTPTARWSPGDTISSCVVPRISHRRSSNARGGASMSIEPLLRDTVRAAVQSLATDDPDPRARGAASLLWRAIGDTERWSAPAAERCRAMLAAAETGAAPPTHTAYDVGRCERTGPELLARAWRTAPADSGRLAALVTATGIVRDRRVQRALQEVALDTSRGTPARRGALVALAVLADAGLAGNRPTMSHTSTEEGRCTFGHGPPREQEEGSDPMGPGARGEIVGFLWSLADRAGDGDPLAHHAARLARCISEPGRPPRPHP